MVTTLQLVAWHDTCLLLINLPETVRKVLVYFSPLTFQSKVLPFTKSEAFKTSESSGSKLRELTVCVLPSS